VSRDIKARRHQVQCQEFDARSNITNFVAVLECDAGRGGQAQPDQLSGIELLSAGAFRADVDGRAVYADPDRENGTFDDRDVALGASTQPDPCAKQHSEPRLAFHPPMMLVLGAVRVPIRQRVSGLRREMSITSQIWL
jgi:hypothetical protein